MTDMYDMGKFLLIARVPAKVWPTYACGTLPPRPAGWAIEISGAKKFNDEQNRSYLRGSWVFVPDDPALSIRRVDLVDLGEYDDSLPKRGQNALEYLPEFREAVDRAAKFLDKPAPVHRLADGWEGYSAIHGAIAGVDWINRINARGPAIAEALRAAAARAAS